MNREVVPSLIRVETRAVGVDGQTVVLAVEWLTPAEKQARDQRLAEQEQWRSERQAAALAEQDAWRSKVDRERDQIAEAHHRGANPTAFVYTEQRRQAEKTKLLAHLEHELYDAEERLYFAEKLSYTSPTNPEYQRAVRDAVQRCRVLASDLKGAQR